MNTLQLTDRELEYVRWQFVRDRSFSTRPDDNDMVLVLKAKIIRACGEVPTTTPKTRRVWDAVKAVSNG